VSHFLPSFALRVRQCVWRSLRAASLSSLGAHRSTIDYTLPLIEYTCLVHLCAHRFQLGSLAGLFAYPFRESVRFPSFLVRVSE